jgi:uncharacterized phage-like protein YoqJ
MKLAVIGSRTFTNYTQMEKYLSAKDSIEAIITGDASGADQLAFKFARNNNIPIESYPQDKETIVDRCDAIIAFWDGKSTGTQNVLNLAKKKNKPLEVIFLEKKEHESPFGYISLPPKN